MDESAQRLGGTVKWNEEQKEMINGLSLAASNCSQQSLIAVGISIGRDADEGFRVKCLYSLVCCGGTLAQTVNPSCSLKMPGIALHHV